MKQTMPDTQIEFDAHRAYRHIEQLAFPRLAGSAGERKARDYLLNELAAQGYTVTREPFTYSRFPAEALPQLIAIVSIGGVVSACLFYERYPLVAVVLCFALILVVFVFTRWRKSLEPLYDLGKRYPSENIVAKNHSALDARPQIVFVAHYDAKSQVLPIVVRALCYTIASIGLVALTALIVIQALFVKGLPKAFVWGTGACILLCLLTLLLNFTQNRSPGAFDNASGVGVVLELARCLKSSSVPVTFLFTGAEEFGMCGALRYAQQHTPNPETYFINIDSVGTAEALSLITRYGIPPVTTSTQLGQALANAAADTNVELRQVYLPVGVGFDHIPIASRSGEAVTLSSGGFGGASLRVHSARDTIDLIQPTYLQRVGDVVLNFLRQNIA